MMSKEQRVASMLGGSGTAGIEPHYSGFFERFNRGEYFEAHDVLEQLWLKDRNGPNGAFYKGLIQLAGAFVHVRKQRGAPALALLKLAELNLGRYPPLHEGLEFARVQALITTWREKIEGAGPHSPIQLGPASAPQLLLR